MFTSYSNIPGLTIYQSTKLGYEFNFIKGLLVKYNIIDILRFLKNIEHHFNIPLFNLVITSEIYNKILTNPNENLNKVILIMKFLKIIRTYYLIDNGISLIKQLMRDSSPFAQKMRQILALDHSTAKPLVLAQIYGYYQGSVIPFYVHTSSWYVRTGLLADGELIDNNFSYTKK